MLENYFTNIKLLAKLKHLYILLSGMAKYQTFYPEHFNSKLLRTLLELLKLYFHTESKFNLFLVGRMSGAVGRICSFKLKKNFFVLQLVLKFLMRNPMFRNQIIPNNQNHHKCLFVQVP